MNRGALPPEEPSEGSGARRSHGDATAGFGRDRRYRLRWRTWAVVPVSLLWPGEGGQVFRTMIGRVTRVQEGRR